MFSSTRASFQHMPSPRVATNECPPSSKVDLLDVDDGAQAMASTSPSSPSITAPPPSPVHSSSTAPSSPFSTSSVNLLTTPPPSSSSSSSSASPSTSSLHASALHVASSSPAHLPPLRLPMYDEDAKASTYSLPVHDHGDGSAWLDDGDKGFHAREAKGKDDAEREEKDAPLPSSSSSSPSSPAADPKASSTSSAAYVQSVREAERVAKAAEKEAALSAERLKASAEEEKYLADQHKLLHLLTSMYRCRECMPTWKDREEQRLGIETNEYSSRRLGELCCIGHALSSSFPPSLPLDLLPLTQGYLLSQPTRSFLTHPPPVSAGVIQCLTGDHMVLTRSGWRSIRAIARGDVVASFNLTTSAMEWKPVKETQRYKSAPTGRHELFRMQAEGMDVVATREHRMLTGLLDGHRHLKAQSFAYETVEELLGQTYVGPSSKQAETYNTKLEHSHDRVVVRSAFNKQPPFRFCINNLQSVCDWWWGQDEQRGFLRFVGFWLGDGSLQVKEGLVVIAQRRLESTAWLIDLLDEVFPRWWYRNVSAEDDSGITFNYYIRCPPLYEWLRVMAVGPQGYNPLNPGHLRKYPHFVRDAKVEKAEAESAYCARTAGSTWTEDAMLTAFTKGAVCRPCRFCPKASGVRLTCSGERCKSVEAITRAHPACAGRKGATAFAEPWYCPECSGELCCMQDDANEEASAESLPASPTRSARKEPVSASSASRSQQRRASASGSVNEPQGSQAMELDAAPRAHKRLPRRRRVLPTELMYWTPSAAEKEADAAAGIQHVTGKSYRGFKAVVLCDESRRLRYGRQCGGCSERVWGGSKASAATALDAHACSAHADRLSKAAAACRTTRQSPVLTASAESSTASLHSMSDVTGATAAEAEESEAGDDVPEDAEEEAACFAVAGAQEQAAVQAVWNGGLWDIDADGHWFYRKRWMGPDVAGTFANVSQAQAVVLLEGFCRADGTYGRAQFKKNGEPVGCWQFCNSSFPLIDHLQLVGQLAGARVDLRRYVEAGRETVGPDGRTLTTRVDHWSVSCNFNAVRKAPVSISRLAKPVPATDIGARGYYQYDDDGFVYDITVQDNSNFLTQRLSTKRHSARGADEAGLGVRAHPVFVGNCYILKTNNKFELFMEMRDQTEWQSIRKRMVERGHLQDPSNAQPAPNAAYEKSTNSRSTSSYSTSSQPGQSASAASAADKERERSELLERLFRDRQAWRLMMKGGSKASGSSTPGSPAHGAGKGSAVNMGLEERMKENNLKSMLLQHAEGLLQRNEDIFLLAAQRKRAWTGNSYLISMDRENNAKGGEGGSRDFLGKLKSNFGGTEFVMFDCGVKQSKKAGKKADGNGQGAGNGSVTPLTPLSQQGAAGGASKYQRECGVIQYDHFFEHTGSPIRIKILLPNRSFYPLESSALSGAVMKQYRAESKEGSASGSAASSQGNSVSTANNNALLDDDDDDLGGAAAPATTPTSTSASSAAATPSVRAKAGQDVDEYVFQTVGQHVEVFENLRPVWHDGMNAYVLHFDNHRVREKSVKNFKLVRVNDGDKKTVLQFGRVMDRNVFVMDFAWPLSAFQAFAICLSSIDPKIAVRPPTTQRKARAHASLSLQSADLSLRFSVGCAGMSSRWLPVALPTSYCDVHTVYCSHYHHLLTELRYQQCPAEWERYASALSRRALRHSCQSSSLMFPSRIIRSQLRGASRRALPMTSLASISHRPIASHVYMSQRLAPWPGPPSCTVTWGLGSGDSDMRSVRRCSAADDGSPCTTT